MADKIIPKLPTKGQFEKALLEPSKLQDLVSQALNYGTNYVALLYQKDSKSTPPPPPPSADRVKQAGAVLTQVWEAHPTELEGILIDSLWLVSSTSDQESSSTVSTGLSSILSSLLTIPQRETFWKELQATLAPNLLTSVHLLDAEKDTLLKKIRKVNTEIYYRQQKYNLLQEESEGYAKLLTILYDKANLVSVTPERLRTIIGTFELDPNRVLDLLLDLLEQRTQDTEPILSLIRDFSVTKIPHLLAFKLGYYQSSGKPIPSSLNSTIVLLAQNNLLNLATLVPTALTELQACYDLYIKFMKQRISQLGRISLTTDNQPDPKMVESKTKLEEAAQKLETQNALVGLLQILLESDDFKLCSTLLPHTKDWTMVCTLMPEKVGKKLSEWVGSQLLLCHYETHVKTPKLKVVTKAIVANSVSISQNGNGKHMNEDNDEEMNDGDVETTTKETTLEELLENCSVALVALAQSGCLSCEPILYCKLCRLARALLLKDDNSTKNLSPAVYNLMNTVLVPSLSLMPPNPAISADLWSLLSILPYSTRYQLYRDWSGGGLERAGVGSKPYLQVQFEMEAGKAARYTLKRLSKDNIRDMGRQVSKVTHSNPLVVFSTILNQIESYDNLIQMMVETVRFVTPLSLDVLGYCVLSRLSGTVGGVNRSRLKDDGVNVSQWLQSLEGFTGAFYKKCPDVEFRGIMSYLVHRLKDGHVLELGVLKTLIKTAGGYSFADYSPAASLSAQQLEGRAGSLLLKRETFAFGIVEDFDFRASSRVKEVLQSNNLGVSMLILLAQTRSRLLFGGSTKKKHVKLIANLLDTCQVVMYILLEFITDSTVSKIAKSGEFATKDDGFSTVESYAASLPPLEKLFDLYKLDAVSAWMLCRPIFRAILSEKNANGKLLAHSGDRSAIVRRMLPEDAWKHIAPELFDTFFSFSLYDIYFPETSYQTELTRLKETDQRLAHKKKNHQPGVLGMDFNREDDATWERVKITLTAVAEDMEKQKAHCLSIRSSITGKVNSLFPSKSISVAAIQTFITNCVYPRCRLSPDDATYCVRFVMTLHTMETPGFSTMHFIDEFIKILSGSLFSSTEDEAAAIGIMLLDLWKVVSHWRYDEDAFDKEVARKPGAYLVGDDGAQEVSFEEYKSLYNKWHAAIGRATIGGLDSTEYMHVRACFVILTRIVDAFPTRPKLGQNILDALEPLQDETYPLQDIKTAAQAYSTLLIQARSSGVWKEEDLATIKAREDKEKAEVAEKLKRREKQLAEMKRDTDKLNEEIGETGRWDDRDRGRRPPVESRRPTFEPPPPQQREAAGSAPRRDTTNNDNGRRVTSDRAVPLPERQAGAQPRGTLDGRWERGGAHGGSNKRALTPTKEVDQPTKRTRSDRPATNTQNPAPKFEPPPRPGQRGNEPTGSAPPPPPPPRGGDRAGGGYNRRGQQRR